MRSLKLLIFLVLVSFGQNGLADEGYEWRAHPSVEKEFRDSPIVLVGKVIKAGNYLSKDSVDGTFYSVEVTETLKGSPAKTLELYCENSSGRFPMEVGDSYLVFAYRGPFEGISGWRWAIDSSGNSKQLDKAKSTLAQVRSLKRAARKS